MDKYKRIKLMSNTPILIVSVLSIIMGILIFNFSLHVNIILSLIFNSIIIAWNIINLVAFKSRNVIQVKEDLLNLSKRFDKMQGTLNPEMVKINDKINEYAGVFSHDSNGLSNMSSLDMRYVEFMDKLRNVISREGFLDSIYDDDKELLNSFVFGVNGNEPYLTTLANRIKENDNFNGIDGVKDDINVNTKILNDDLDRLNAFLLNLVKHAISNVKIKTDASSKYLFSKLQSDELSLANSNNDNNNIIIANDLLRENVK